ncbi:MAG: tryptophan-rich sensory protein [Bacilli bacterium]|nr:tryptophan-rich sensory protein [Bacilli bacterium]
MKKIDFKKLFFYIFITILIGTIPSVFVFGNMSSYELLNKPALSPPGLVFPIAWTILYILMGISIYRIMMSDNKRKNDAKLIYFIQLVINALWTPIFFGFNEYFLAFLWIIMLILLVITMIMIFFKIDKISSYLNIPYLLWLLFASYLNFGIFVLN